MQSNKSNRSKVTTRNKWIDTFWPFSEQKTLCLLTLYMKFLYMLAQCRLDYQYKLLEYLKWPFRWKKRISYSRGYTWRKLGWRSGNFERSFYHLQQRNLSLLLLYIKFLDMLEWLIGYTNRYLTVEYIDVYWVKDLAVLNNILAICTFWRNLYVGRHF